MSPKLQDISGIGKTTAERLIAAGIDTVEKLAGSTPADLSKIEGIGKASANKYVTNAQTLLEELGGGESTVEKAVKDEEETSITETKKPSSSEDDEGEEEKEEEEELEEELIAGFDEEDDPALQYKQNIDAKFWQKPEFKVLLDFDLAKDSEVAFYDLSNLVDNFFNTMLKEDMINYKISGIALKSAASLHHYKISSIIKQEEKIQKEEELQKLRKRHQRTIPKALPQPIQPKLQVATKDELFGAMRAAIIETMQKKEKLKRRRVRRDAQKEKRKKMRSKAKLPKEILRHISGKEQTIDELHETWLNRIKATMNLHNKKETSIFELADLIKNDEESGIGRKFGLVRLFLALMFLSTPGSSGTSKTSAEIELMQNEEFKDINIQLK